MLGLADRTRVIDLFHHLATGDIAAAFKEFRDQYDTGADPVVVLSDLAEFVNFVTRVKYVPATADNVAFSETERLRARDFATKLSTRVLSRMWQMLLKGIAETQAATRPAAAAEMVLVRIAYAADLPTPDEAIRMIEQNGGNSPIVTSNAAPRGAPAPAMSASEMSASSMPAMASSPVRTQGLANGPTLAAIGGGGTRPQLITASAAPQQQPSVLRLASFPELVALAGRNRDVMIKGALESDVRLVRFEDGRLEIALERHAQRTLVSDLSRKLEEWTGRRWTVTVSNETGQPTLREQNLQAKNERERAAEADPRVQEVLARFPGAKVVEVRKLAPEPPEAEVSSAVDPVDESDNDDQDSF
jgi:DNA polymerase-3 subunit gamma/tau